MSTEPQRLAYTADEAINLQRPHRDDEGVDALAGAMKTKLAKKRAEGYAGWDSPLRCSAEKLSQALATAVGKGDPVDVANFAMMLFSRKADPALIREHALRALLRGARERLTAALMQVRAIVANDSYAITFQSMAQYRTALLKNIDTIQTGELQRQPCAHCGGSGLQEDVFEQVPAVATGDTFVREFEEWVKVTGALPWGSSLMDEVSHIIQRAAQAATGAQGLTDDVLNRLIDLGAEAKLCHTLVMSDDGHAGTEALKKWSHLRDQMRAILAQAAPAAGATGGGEHVKERLRNSLTPFGMLVRALRIVSGTLLMDMARDLQTTPAALSAYECGRTPIPPELPRYAAIFFAREGIADTEPALRAALAASRKGNESEPVDGPTHAPTMRERLLTAVAASKEAANATAPRPPRSTA